MRIIISLKYFFIYILIFYPRNLVKSRHYGQDLGNKRYGRQRYESGNPFEDFSLVSVNIDRQFSTKTVKYKYDPPNNHHIFTARYPNLIYKIKDSLEVFWLCKDGNYAYKVILTIDDKGDESLTLFYPDFKPKVRQKLPFEPVYEPKPRRYPPDPKSRYKIYPHLIILNIKYRYCTELVDYEYNHQKGTHTFTAIHPFLFGLILKGDHVEWDPETPEYPERVLIFPDSKGKYTMRLFFPGKLPMPFKHVTSWHGAMEKVSEPLVKSHVDESESADIVVSDKLKTKEVELNIDDLTSTESYELITNKDFMRWNKTHIFNARDGFKFNKVKTNQMTLWDARHKSEYSSKVILSTELKGHDILSIHTDNQKIIAFKRQKKLFSTGYWQEDKDISSL